MKSTTIDIHNLIANLRGERPMNKPVGYAKDAHGTYYAGFVATYPPTHEVNGVELPHPQAGQPVLLGGRRHKINWRVSRNQS